MAKPPTQLTDLLRRSPDTAAAVQSLLNAGSVAWHARRTPAADAGVTAFIVRRKSTPNTIRR